MWVLRIARKQANGRSGEMCHCFLSEEKLDELRPVCVHCARHRDDVNYFRYGRYVVGSCCASSFGLDSQGRPMGEFVRQPVAMFAKRVSKRQRFYD